MLLARLQVQFLLKRLNIIKALRKDSKKTKSVLKEKWQKPFSEEASFLHYWHWAFQDYNTKSFVWQWKPPYKKTFLQDLLPSQTSPCGSRSSRKKNQKKQQGNQGKHSPMVASKTTAIANFSYSSAGKSISWPRTGSFIQQTYKSHSRTSTSQHASTSTTFIFRKTSKQDVSWNTVKLLRILGQTNHR